ncbi:insulinoma-associated protein 1a [Cetorhinus maximus]
MPRGFLVKRNNKSSPVSYRIRTEVEEHQLLEVHPLGADVRAVACPDSVSHRNSPDPLNAGLTQDNVLNSAHRAGVLSEDGASEEFYSKKTFSKCGISGWANVSYTPIKPTDIKLENAFLDRCLSSSASVDSFSAAASLKPVERFLVQPSLPPVDVKRGGITHLHPDPRHRKHKASPKKPKVIRKLNFEDEVSTSPVLGLRIKVDARDCKPSASAHKLLAEFICQLCKERYSDSFSLAQHKCSRIVRIEYRCPECDKVFSCPANLASHRRWHKPRPGGNNSGPNPRKESSKDTDSPCAGALLPPGPGWKVERFECPYCSKRFRRQAYLKKHLAAHEAARSTFPNRLELSRITFPCQLCDVYLPSAEIRNKHLLWHAVSRGEAALLSPSCGQKCSAPRPKEHDDAGDLEGQLFSCKHCPSTFFSSPGLTRHINKCHPSENRQVLLLQLPIRPGC